VRPLFLVEPKAPAAWSNWWTYLYGPDILVSPIWQKNQRTQEVYLPSGSQWHDAWHPKKIYDGGRTITVKADLHQMPIFVRVGSNVELGDLNQEWTDAVAAANTRPDLKQLDAEVREWLRSQFAADAGRSSATTVKVTGPGRPDSVNGQSAALNGLSSMSTKWMPWNFLQGKPRRSKSRMQIGDNTLNPLS